MGSASLPPSNSTVLGQAVQAAYLAFQGQSWSPPAGWQNVASVTGWDAVVWKLGKEELFGLLFQSMSDTAQFLVAFRGTNSDVDLYRDPLYFTEAFTAYGGSSPPSPAVARGWFGVYSGLGGSMTASMQGQLFALVDKYSIGNLYITGHSLGGALAQLFALDVAVSAPSIQASTVTWAAPKVGLADWAGDYATYVADSVSIANQYDVVPTLPPSWVAPNYEPVGQPFAVAFVRDGIGFNPVNDVLIRHEMNNYLTVVDMILAQGSAPWVGTFADGVFSGVTDKSEAPSGAGAAAVAAVLEMRSQQNLVRAAQPPLPNQSRAR